MRVLWFSPTPSRYKNEKNSYGGGGWIESLQSLLENTKEIDKLGIVFSHSTDFIKISENKVTYYPLKRSKSSNRISWVISNWRKIVDPKEEIAQIPEIINDFKPDVIHIFGTESWLCHVMLMTNTPSIVHLQGLLLPYLNTYNQIGISNYDLIKSNWNYFIKGFGLWHDKKIIEKKSVREYKYFKSASFFMGRTNWDKSISGFLSPSSTYFHVDEVLREIFYISPSWKYEKKGKIIITSTLSDSIIKGLDLVIKTAKLLIEEGIDFEWKIIGITVESKYALLLKKKFNVDYISLNIGLLGIRRAEEIVDILSETTIYVHTSYIDNSPNSLCEALLLGVPTIATDVGGISSLIEDGKDGFLVPANDPYFLASRITQLSYDEKCMTNISEQARDKASIRHSRENILNQLICTYKNISKKD